MNLALPRVRDFKGLSPKAFDGQGNFTMGLRDQLIFPEIDYAKVDKPHGMNITIVTTAHSNDEAHALLKLMGMPFRQAKDEEEKKVEKKAEKKEEKVEKEKAAS